MGSVGSSSLGSQLSLGASAGRRSYVPRKVFFANLQGGTPPEGDGYPPPHPETAIFGALFPRYLYSCV